MLKTHKRKEPLNAALELNRGLREKILGKMIPYSRYHDLIKHQMLNQVLTNLIKSKVFG